MRAKWAWLLALPFGVDVGGGSRAFTAALAHAEADARQPAQLKVVQAALTPSPAAPSTASPPASDACAADPACHLAVGLRALRAGDPELALREWEGLERDFPPLKLELNALRLSAKAASPQFRNYRTELERADDFDVLLQVTDRLLAAGELGQAERFAGFASRRVRGKTSREVALRRVRARIYLGQDRPFLGLWDLRWLALEQPATAAGAEALQVIEARFPKHPLQLEERRKRLENLASAGALATFRTEVVHARDLGAVLTPAWEAHWTGQAAFAAGDFATAAEAFTRAADQNAPTALSDRFQAARAHAKLGQGARAIEAFARVAATKPPTPLTLKAALQVASEHALAGNWIDANAAYDSFLRHFGGSDQRPQAERGWAVSAFALGRYAEARSVFHRLAVTHDDVSTAALYPLLEAICTLRLGNVEEARHAFLGLAQRFPVSFAGVAAQKHLLALGVQPPLAAPLPVAARLAPLELPSSVLALEAAGLGAFAEQQLQGLERSLSERWPTADASTFCRAYAELSEGRRRFEWGTSAASRLGFLQNPNTQPDWLWRCFYPTPFSETVTAQAARYGLPAALLYAIMRQESGFRGNAISPANAFGLMQLIRPTANRVAEELGVEPNGDLFERNTNIRFGTHYVNHLRGLLRHPAAVVAAYNAGPRLIQRLEISNAGMPLELWMLRIPYRETRSYVQRVLANAEVYSRLYPQLGRVDIPLEIPTEALPSLAGEPTEPSTSCEEDCLY